MLLFLPVKNKWSILLIFLLAFSAKNIIGQTSITRENFEFERFKLPGGALANQVRQIVQDENGFLWFATRNGLIKYDNTTFKFFQKDLADDNSFTTNLLFSLLIDSEGMLWIGTYGGGLAKFDPTLEKFLPIDKIKKHLSKYDKVYVYSLLEDKQKNLWIGTAMGLFKYNKISQKITSYLLDEKRENALHNSVIWSLYLDKEETIWVGTGIPWEENPSAGGLHKYNRETDDFSRYLHDPNDPNSIADNRIEAIFEDANNNFWIGTMGEGLHLMDRSTGKFTRYGNQTNPSNSISRPYIQAPDYASKDFSQVTFVHEDQLERLWIGAFNGGLNIYNPSTKQQLHFEVTLNDLKAIQSNYLVSLFETKDRTIFICTGDVGDLYTDFVIKANYSSNLFKIIPLPKENIYNDVIKNIIEDKLGNFWLGTDYGEAVYKWDDSEGKLENKTTYFKKKLINDFQINSNGNLWTSYKNGGIEITNISDSAVESTQLPEYLASQLSTENILSTFEASNGHLWISRETKGVTCIQKNKSLIHLSHDNDRENDLSAETVDFILEDEKENIWLLGNTKDNDGVHNMSIDKYDPTINKTTAFLPLGFEKGFTLSADLDHSDNLWFTNGLDGIKKLNTQTGSLETFNTSNSLIPTDKILALTVTKEGLIWMSASNQIISYNPSSLTFKKYGQLDGMSIELSPSGIYETRNGQLIFGGENAFLILDPKQLNTEINKTEIKFTDLKINNEPISIASEVLNNIPIWDTKQIELAHFQNNISIGISCLDYHSEDNPVEYFLGNHDSYWRKIGPDKLAAYINIPTGKYVLKTRGANSSGDWFEYGPSLEISIKAPWWKTWWAYLAYFLVGFLLIYGFYRFQLKRQLEIQEAKRLVELDETKSRLYTNITHEFRTPITVMLGMANRLNHHFKERNIFRHQEAVELINRNGEQLLNLVNQMLDLSKLESKAMAIEMQQADVIVFIKYLFESFHSYADSKDIRMHFSRAQEVVLMDFDQNKIQQIIANLLSNAIKFTPSGGIVNLHLSQLDTAQFVIKIQDSGIGIPKEQIPFIFDRFYQSDNTHTRKGEGTGIGLALTKELVHLLKGKIEVISIPKEGSTFTVNLPITQNAPLTTEQLVPNKTTSFGVENTKEITSIPPTELNQNTHQTQLLIVEDNPDVIFYLKECLQEHYHLLIASNGQLGIDKAIEFIPDIIISDVMMPEKDGFELCNTLKTDERTSHIPIILLTAKATVADKIVGLERGADAYLVKPFQAKELEVRLRKLLELRNKLQQRYATGTISKATKDPILKIEDEFVLKVQQIVMDNLDNTDFTVDDLCKSIFLSRTQVHRKLTALVGKSTSLFIRSIRLQEAKKLLENTSKPIQEIAFDVGFKEASYFSRVFAEEFGYSPSSLRK